MPGKTWLDIIFVMFLVVRLHDILLHQTSTALMERGDPALTFDKLICYIGLWVLMTTYSGWTHDNFCLLKPQYERH